MTEAILENTYIRKKLTDTDERLQLYAFVPASAFLVEMIFQGLTMAIRKYSFRL